MLLGITLLYVGAVLVLNSIWLAGRIEDREIIVINVAVAAISTSVALGLTVGAVDQEGVRNAAMTLLFAITYGWVAYNRATGCDGRGLGWFSLFVAITVLPMAFVAVSPSLWGVWMAASWAAWSTLWFIYFLELGLGWHIRKLTVAATFATGVLTGWLPGLLYLHGVMP
ncbi:AmiS/UreI family transporter [Aliiroseovarius sediminis]|uniref:AmiS/UreI family transporter n=1 Tax=Aliiroseovarius sediminis TaxID=2925839 RepID=UPI001F56DCD7|nr:AmiS/UreI family transporter [Aliiroseovarius sediminis]MCI2393782.1 transporter [Aliiroseovarius sediminis]